MKTLLLRRCSAGAALSGGSSVAHTVIDVRVARRDLRRARCPTLFTTSPARTSSRSAPRLPPSPSPPPSPPTPSPPPLSPARLAARQLLEIGAAVSGGMDSNRALCSATCRRALRHCEAPWIIPHRGPHHRRHLRPLRSPRHFRSRHLRPRRRAFAIRMSRDRMVVTHGSYA